VPVHRLSDSHKESIGTSIASSDQSKRDRRIPSLAQYADCQSTMSTALTRIDRASVCISGEEKYTYLCSKSRLWIHMARDYRVLI